MDNPKTEKEKTLSMPNTPVTLGSLQYEVAHLKELLFTRIIAIEQGIKVAHDDFVRFPTEVDKRIGATERFLGNKIDHVIELYKLDVGYIKEIQKLEVDHIKEQFGNIEKLRCEQNANLDNYLKEQKADNISNLVTALNANKELNNLVNSNHKEAMNKSEAFYSKQIEMLITTQQSGFNILKDSITEIKLVVGQGIGKDTGQERTQANQRANISLIIAFLVMAFMMYKTLIGK